MSGLSGTSNGGPEAVLVELSRAISRAADALAAIPDDDEATAYSCAKALDVAFGDLTELLRAAPRIVGIGEPSRLVIERVKKRRADLAMRRGEVAAYREKLDELEDSERTLAEVTSDAHRLRERVSELERAKRLASEIPGLRTQVMALENDVVAADAADAPEIGTRIADAAGRFAALTERQREAIGEEADGLVVRAEKAARELDEQRARRDATSADLAKRESEAAQLATQHSEKLPVLTAWSKADADLADGLRAAGFGAGDSALDIIVAELKGIGQRLTSLDDGLRPLLADHAKAYEGARQIRPL